jgi:hypothetical protein
VRFIESASHLLQGDPFVFYTLAAALLLLGISLIQGWLRLDFIAVIQPYGLFHLTLAVLCAFLLVLALAFLTDPLAARDFETRNLISRMLAPVPRLPLYIIALAYGPSAGLLAALLFAAFGSDSGELGYLGMLLGLELIVIGWFAIAPSPFRHRWAGPFNVAVAYLLTWATAGAAYLDYLTGHGLLLQTHLNYHAAHVVGLGICLLLLFCILPEMYRRLFAGSRLNPHWYINQPGGLKRVTVNTREKTMIEPALPQLTRSDQRKRHRLIDPRQTKILDNRGKGRR